MTNINSTKWHLYNRNAQCYSCAYNMTFHLQASVLLKITTQNWTNKKKNLILWCGKYGTS